MKMALFIAFNLIYIYIQNLVMKVKLLNVWLVVFHGKEDEEGCMISGTRHIKPKFMASHCMRVCWCKDSFKLSQYSSCVKSWHWCVD